MPECKGEFIALVREKERCFGAQPEIRPSNRRAHSTGTKARHAGTTPHHPGRKKLGKTAPGKYAEAAKVYFAGKTGD